MYNPLIYCVMNYGHMKQVRVEAKRVAELKSELFEKQLDEVLTAI